MYNEIVKGLINSGYINLKKDNDGIGIFAKEDKLVVTVVAYDRYCTTDFFISLNEYIEKNLLENGVNTSNYIKLIFTDEPSKLKQALCFDKAYWIFDTSKNTLLIYDEQPYSFGDLKDIIENVVYGKPIFNKKTIKEFPYITCLLIIVNVLYYIVIKNNGGFDNYTMARYGAAVTKYIVERKEYYRIFTSMFMHFGMEHLYMNMISLLIMGSLLEREFGKVRFLITYLLSGICGGIVSVVSYYIQGKLVISAGASGAIFGVLGALAVTNFVGQKKTHTMSPKTILVLIILSVLSGFNNTGYDVYAHIGGFIGGIILSLFFYKGKVRKLHKKNYNKEKVEVKV